MRFAVALAVLVTSVVAARGGDVAAQIVFDSRTGPIEHALRYAPLPEIPVQARQQHLTGTGVYAIDIDAGGQVSDVRVVHSSGHKILDDAAVRTLRSWVFHPRAGYKATVPITFGPTGVATPHAETRLPARR